MKRITFIVGLPGSGKTSLAGKLAGEASAIIDDISVSTEEKLAIDAEHLIITDPNACAVAPERVTGLLRTWFGECEIEFIAFQNDVEGCLRNLSLRRDDRVISRRSIEALAKNYRPAEWGPVIPVWKSDQE